MRLIKRFVFVSILALLLSSCSNTTSNITSFISGCPDGIIEWVDILMINDIQYEHHYPEAANENLPITIDQGKELGKVTYEMADNACSNHKMKNGDAAYLTAGTVIYEVKGYPSSLLVSANDEVYVVSTNDIAKTAGELYPMDKLVNNIYIESTEDGQRIHTFSQSSKEQFLALFSELKLADVETLSQEGKLDGNRLFLGIELNNGVSFRQLYWIDSNTFHNGAIGNDEIQTLIEDELIHSEK